MCNVASDTGGGGMLGLPNGALTVKVHLGGMSGGNLITVVLLAVLTHLVSSRKVKGLTIELVNSEPDSEKNNPASFTKHLGTLHTGMAQNSFRL